MDDLIAFELSSYIDLDKYNSFFNKLETKNNKAKKNEDISVLVFKDDSKKDPTYNAYFIINLYQKEYDNVKILNIGENYFLEQYKNFYKDAKVINEKDIDLDTLKFICLIFIFKYTAKVLHSIYDMNEDIHTTEFIGSYDIHDVPSVSIYIQKGIFLDGDYKRFTFFEDHIKKDKLISGKTKRRVFDIPNQEYYDMAFNRTLENLSYENEEVTDAKEAEKEIYDFTNSLNQPNFSPRVKRKSIWDIFKKK